MQQVRLIALIALLLPALSQGAGENDTAVPSRPKIEKLGTVAVMKMENSPVVFHGKLYRVEWDRATDNFYFTEHDTGKTTAPFAKGWAFANAFVDGDTMYVTGAQHGPEVRMFISKDLEHWESRPALKLPGWEMFNTSICKAGDRYVMMFEVGGPEAEAGVAFTARFAESKDLEQWTVLGRECTYDRARYSAPHALRYIDGYFYNFFLESVHEGYRPPHGGYEMNVVRSKDLIHWTPSPLQSSAEGIG